MFDLSIGESGEAEGIQVEMRTCLSRGLLDSLVLEDEHLSHLPSSYLRHDSEPSITANVKKNAIQSRMFIFSVT